MKTFRINPLNVTVTREQRDRLADIAASGPLLPREGDEELIRLGLVFAAPEDGCMEIVTVNGHACIYNVETGRFLPKLKD